MARAIACTAAARRPLWQRAPLRHRTRRVQPPPPPAAIRTPQPPRCVGQDDGLLGAGRSHQVQHPRHALPAHVHAKSDLGHAHMGVSGHHAKVQRDRQRHAAAKASMAPIRWGGREAAPSIRKRARQRLQNPITIPCSPSSGLGIRATPVSHKSTQQWRPMCAGQRCHPGPVRGHAEIA